MYNMRQKALTQRLRVQHALLKDFVPRILKHKKKLQRCSEHHYATCNCSKKVFRDNQVVRVAPVLSYFTLRIEQASPIGIR